MSWLIIGRCSLCGAFDVELYEEIKALGLRCVDRTACEARWPILQMPCDSQEKTK